MDTLKFHMISDVIKQYIDAHNDKEPGRKYVRCGCIVLNKNSADPIKVMQFQPDEEINADKDLGTRVLDDNYICKVNSFIDESINEKADLILTPEYSVPYETIDALVSKKDDIRRGSLFCMCAEGASQERVEEYLTKWSQTDKCYVYDISYKNSDDRKFWCVLFYVFKISFFYNDKDGDDILIIIPQCKTTHMRDEKFYFETGNLSTGDDIFIFDIEHENDYRRIGNSNNKFFSMLCSDVFEQDQYISHIRRMQEKENSGIIIFHPQLNQKPMHGSFNVFRQRVFELLGENAAIITSTWGKNTKVNTLDFQTSNSSLYLYEKNKSYIVDKEEVIGKNHKKNVTLGVDRNIKKWMMPSGCFLIEYEVLKPNNDNRADLSLDVLNPTVNYIKVFSEEEKDFVEHTKCLYQPLEIIRKLCSDTTNINYDDIINQVCGKCDGECKILDFMYFIGSFFGNFYNEELEMTPEEKSKQMGLMFSGGYTINRDKISNFKKIVNILSKNNIPNEFKEHFNEGCSFYIKRTMYSQESYNIICVDGSKYRFIYLGDTTREEAPKIFDKMCKNREEVEKLNTIVFYFDPFENEGAFYFKPQPVYIDEHEEFKIDVIGL